MLIDKDINIHFDDSWTTEVGGKAIAFVINNDVVHTMASKLAFHDLLLNFSSEVDLSGRTVIDLSDSVLEEDSAIEGEFKLNFVKNNEIIDSITTSQENLRAILLSDPTVIVLQPEVKILGVEPGWKYINQEFTRS
jgi:hypothetical protein